MTGPKGNGEFFNVEGLGETNLLFPLGPVINSNNKLKHL